jgi:multidrug efflux pump subunit AcrA (membrane-fusion protein)
MAGDRGDNACARGRRTAFMRAVKLCFASVALLAPLAASRAGESEPDKTNVITVERVCYDVSIRVSGFVVARAETGASLETPGYRVTEVLVNAGDSVEPGEELLRARLEAAPPASQNGLTSAAPAQTSLRSPVKGIVTVVNARVGDVVGRNAPTSPEAVQFRIALGSDLDVFAEVPSLYALRFTKGLTAKILRPDQPPISGVVHAPVSVVDRATQMGHARIAIAQSDGLKAGQFVSADVRLPDRCGLIIPLSAVRFKRDKAFVKVVTGSGPVERQVRYASPDRGRIEILDGLRSGDRVIAFE